MLTSLPSAFPGVEIKGPVNPVEVGGQVEVVCNGSGAPPPEIRWMKDGPHPQTKLNWLPPFVVTCHPLNDCLLTVVLFVLCIHLCGTQLEMGVQFHSPEFLETWPCSTKLLCIMAEAWKFCMRDYLVTIMKAML